MEQLTLTERRFADGDTNEAFIADWQNTGLRTDRIIRSHRAPQSYNRRATASLLVIAASIGCLIGGSDIVDSDAYTTSANDSYINARMNFSDHTNNIADNSVFWDHQYIERQRKISFSNMISRKSRTDNLQSNKDTTSASAFTLMQRPEKFIYPVLNGRISSCYGMRGSELHTGIDFAAPTGTSIKSVTDGIVVQAGWRYKGLGYSVVVKHNNGYMTMYGHASKVLVTVGQHVHAGQSIALVGSTGHATGPHLHLNVAKTSSMHAIFSSLVNPAPWLRSHGLSLSRC